MAFKKILLSILSILSILSSSLALDPQSISFTNLRQEADASVSAYQFYQGQPILLTNCVLYSGTSTSSAPENLTGEQVKIRIGTTTTFLTVTGTVQNATSGLWNATFTVPTNSAIQYLQISVTNGVTTYTYPNKILNTRSPLP